MVKCHPRAYAQCPDRHICCGSIHEANFMEGSNCDIFNQRILNQPMTMADKIRAMSDEDLTDMIYDLNMEGTFCQNRKECEELLNNDGITDEMCKKCLLEYLRKPVEEPKLPSGIYLDKEESGLTEEG